MITFIQSKRLKIAHFLAEKAWNWVLRLESKSIDRQIGNFPSTGSQNRPYSGDPDDRNHREVDLR